MLTAPHSAYFILLVLLQNFFFLKKSNFTYAKCLTLLILSLSASFLFTVTKMMKNNSTFRTPRRTPRCSRGIRGDTRIITVISKRAWCPEADTRERVRVKVK